MIIKFLKRSVIEVLEAVSALASVFAYMLAINTFMSITDRFDRWKERTGVSCLW